MKIRFILSPLESFIVPLWLGYHKHRVVFLSLHSVWIPCTGSLSKQAAAASKKGNTSQISHLLVACAHIDTEKQKEVLSCRKHQERRAGASNSREDVLTADPGPYTPCPDQRPFMYTLSMLGFQEQSCAPRSEHGKALSFL